MAEVVSTLSQLTFAFKIHSKTAISDSEELSHLLLLFYAVECGLKAKYLRLYKGLDTRDFEKMPTQKQYGYGHNLWQWTKSLKIPNNGFKDELARPLVQMHERLRYGAFSKSNHEIEQIKFLKHIISILKKEF